MSSDASQATDWKIRISGYGTFDFHGTEAEAETMRAHKARWERGSGMKWRTDLLREEDRIRAEIAASFDKNGFTPQDLLRKLNEVKK